jgi:DNA-binding transcriptional regulator YdaS (Cro superfamily)
MKKQDAISHFGSVSALAEALGVSAGAVSQWEEIPAGRQFQLQVLTAGRLIADSVIAQESIKSKEKAVRC